MVVTFIETYPCTEFWFLLHFILSLSTESFHSYDELLLELQKYLPSYEKTEKYFSRTKL